MAGSSFVTPYQPIPFAGSQIYQPNGRLVDLIRLQGEQSAEGQRRAGEIQAQMWGNLGNQITQGVGNVIKAQQEAPINALNQQKVKDAQELSAGQKIVDSALQPVTPQGPVEPGQPPLPQTHPYLSDDGLVDPTKVTALLNANGMGHLAPELLKPIEAQNASVTAYKDHQTETATKQAVMLGSVANTTLALMKTGVPFEDAATHAASSLVASGVMPANVIQGQIQRLAALSPDQQLVGLQQLKATAARLGPTKTLSDGAKEVDMFGETIADNPKNDPGKGDYTINGQRFKADGTPIGTVQPTQTQPKDWQKSSVLLDGKPADILTDPSPNGKIYDLDHKVIENAATRIKPIPSASAVAINAGQLSDVAMEQAARKYLETGQLPPGFGTAGTIQKTAIMNAAAKLDPQAALARNQATFKADSANLTNLQKTEGTLSAFENTAGKNLDQFLALADKIPDTGVPWLNVPVRNLSTNVVGSENMAAINAARDVALREIARVTNDPKLSGALTDTARKEVAGLSAANATLPQIKAVAKVLRQDMANVHAGINEQISSVKNSIGQNPNATSGSTPDLYQQYLDRNKK